MLFPATAYAASVNNNAVDDEYVKELTELVEASTMVMFSNNAIVTQGYNPSTEESELTAAYTGSRQLTTRVSIGHLLEPFGYEVTIDTRVRPRTVTATLAGETELTFRISQRNVTSKRLWNDPASNLVQNINQLLAMEDLVALLSPQVIADLIQSRDQASLMATPEFTNTNLRNNITLSGGMALINTSETFIANQFNIGFIVQNGVVIAGPLDVINAINALGDTDRTAFVANLVAPMQEKATETVREELARQAEEAARIEAEQREQDRDSSSTNGGTSGGNDWRPPAVTYYTVRFDLSGGVYSGDQNLLVQTVRAGHNAIGLSNNPTKSGFNFAGWSPALNLNDVRANRTFVAQWTPVVVPTTYTVTFNPNGGSVVSGNLVQTITAGQSATPPTVTRPDFSFAGWAPTDGWQNVHQNVTLTAQWTPITVPVYHTVTFNLNGGTYAGNQNLLVQSVLEGTNATALTGNPTRENYTFTGWSPAVNVNNVTESRTFTAQWAPNAVTHTVIFDLNGGTRIGGGMLIQEVVTGQNAALPIVELTGYTFEGWDPASGWENVTDNITFTAQWELITPPGPWTVT
ncbi:InlB B-repeat-containing protein, partial [Candidatus Saccharibacteria bacterium]|nr:InlB B-repeat-containing protein [Candidatus Saccharibacteria bacterium]